MNNFRLRAVQLDLARQMETIDFIKEFIDFITKAGFNTLVLYLEGRVRTATFSLLPPDESYSVEEMKEIVEYASQKNIDIIPATQALGHAEHFLQFEEMQHISELRDTDGRGRWTGACPVSTSFCPSLSETKTFLSEYFTELAGIFPSRYFNLGMDEVWHIGICDLCRKHPGSQAGIFADHINWLYSVISKKLGKRMMIWDDMFQHYPDVLNNIPNDIILCAWHYDAVMHFPYWHFGTQPRVDKLNLYAKLGFECIICPADFTLRNTTTFTEYASSRPCMGALLTMWEKSDCFYNESFPAIAYAGNLWQGMSSGNAFKSALESIFECSETVFSAILKTAKEINIWYWRRDCKAENYLRGELKEEEYIIKTLTDTLTETLSQYLIKINNPRGKMVLENMLLRLEYGKIYTMGREIIPRFFDPEKSPSQVDRERLKNLLEAFRDHYSKLCDFWARVRPGIPHKALDSFFTTAIQSFSSLMTKEANGLLTLRLFDIGITQDTEVLVKFTDSTEWESIFNTRLTPYYHETCHERSFPVSFDRVPVAIRFETWGYGTQGINFIEIVNSHGRFIPGKIQLTKGQVTGIENILADDASYANLGESYSIENFNNHGSNANKKRHGIELLLKKEQFN